MVTPHEVSRLIKQIGEGRLDSDLAAIIHASTSRLARVASGNAPAGGTSKATEAPATESAPIRVGSIVEFTGHIKPRYLVGVRGTITKINEKSCVVSIGADGGRFANTEPRCPKALIRLVA